MVRFARRLATVFAAALLLLSVVGTVPVAAKGLGWSHRDAHVCGKATAGEAQCTAIARSFFHGGTAFHAGTRSALATAVAADLVGYVDGATIRTAYGITAVGDPSRVVAIVDAYDDPSAYANLTRFRSDAGLPAIPSCTLAALTALTSSATSPCFSKVNQTGGTTLPKADSGWSNEIDLDLQAVSSVCPMCSIVLLEATTSSLANLGTAVTTASNTAHVLAISNSYGAGDYPGTFATAWDNAAKKGIAVMASTGDGGYGAEFPASATNVIGVGGTTLSVSDTTGIRTTEIAWGGSGSGCSAYNAAPAWQSIPGNPCASKKAVADVSADADPSSGLATYTTYTGVTGYWIFGGTSLASPLVAAQYAEQGGYGASNLAGKYAWAASTPYFDVTSGSNGTCSPSVLCNAGTGWDGPTGRGSMATSSTAPVLTSITVSPSSASVLTGATQQFNATAKDQFGGAMSPQPTITWSVTGDSTISSTGLVTAGATAGTFTVTASSGPVTGTAGITVTVPQVLTSVTVTPQGASVQSGATRQFTAIAKDQNGQPMTPQPAMTWSASGGTISASGLFTAGSTAGPFTVTAISGVISGMANGTVTSIPPDFQLAVTPSAQSVKRGGTATYQVTITPLTGFSGSVNLTVSGQPSGSTAAFSVNPTTGASTLTIRTSSSTSRRTYTLTITGVSGGLSHGSTASLTVTR